MSNREKNLKFDIIVDSFSSSSFVLSGSIVWMNIRKSCDFWKVCFEKWLKKSWKNTIDSKLTITYRISKSCTKSSSIYATSTVFWIGFKRHKKNVMMNNLIDQITIKNDKMNIVKTHKQIPVIFPPSIDMNNLIKIMNNLSINFLTTIFENRFSQFSNVSTNYQIGFVSNDTTENQIVYFLNDNFFENNFQNNINVETIISISKTISFQFTNQCWFCQIKKHRRMKCSNKNAFIFRNEIYEI